MRSYFFKAVFFLAAFVVVISVWSKGEYKDPNLKDLPNPSNFVLLGKWSTHQIEVDTNNLAKTMDKDGDMISGGVFRITYTRAVEGGSLDQTKVFINAVAGVCGYNGIILMTTTAFKEDGTIVATATPHTPMQTDKTGPIAQMYYYLCPSNKRERWTYV